MSARDYQELTRLLSTGPLPPSNCVSYKQSLTSEQVKEVAALVEGHATLRGLRLKGCEIDADGADALSQALSFNTVLTSLELPCNNISGEGALFFATALRVYNHTLRTLDLQGNPCLAQEDAMSEIAQHLARNASEAVRAVSPRLALRSPYRIREVEAAVPSEVQLESRVLHLESDMQTQAEEIESLKEVGAELSGWKAQLDVASGQMAQVLEMLKSEIDELREHVVAQAAASPPAAPGAASGADVASLAAQFRSRHEELARSLQRLEGAVGTRPGAQDTHRLLVDSVESLTKRLATLEAGSAAAGHASEPALEGLRQQVQQLADQQQSLAAGAATVAQLASVQQQLRKALAVQQVDEALSRLEDLHQRVTEASQELKDVCSTAELTSRNVAALANTCADLRRQVDGSAKDRQAMQRSVEKAAGEAEAAARLAASAASGMRALEECQGGLQEEVGKLHLAVDSLEQTLDSFDPTDRLNEHASRLERVEQAVGSGMEPLRAQVAEQGEALHAAAQAAAAAAAQAAGASAAAVSLQEAVAAQPGQWAAAIEAAATPLQQQLGVLEANQAEGARSLQEATTALSARVEGVAAGLASLEAAVGEQPALWEAAVGGAIAPLQREQQQLWASLAEQQGSSDRRLAGVEAQAAAAAEQLSAAERAIADLQAASAQQPARWEQAVADALMPLQLQLGEQKGQVISAAAQASGASAAVAELREALSAQPDQWGAAVEATTAPLQQQLSALASRQEEGGRELQAVQEAASALNSRVEEAESAVGALRAGLEQQPAQWQAAVEGAVAPLAQSMDTLQLQQGEAGRALDAVQGRLGEAEAAVAELQAAASKQPRLWQGDIQGAFTPLRVQVETLAEQQAEAAQAAQAVHEGLASQVHSVSTQLGSIKETLAGLEATASSHPGLWQAAVAEATGPLHEQVSALQQQLSGLATQAREGAAAVTALSAAVGQQPGEWRAALEGLAQQVRGLEALHVALTADVTQQPAAWGAAVQGVGQQVVALQGEVSALSAAVAAQPEAWGAAIDGLAQGVQALDARHAGTVSSLEAAQQGISTLESQLAAVRAEQGSSAEALGDVQQAMGPLAAKLEWAEGAIRSLESAAQQLPGEVEAAVAAAAEPLQQGVEALRQGQAEASQRLSATDATVGAIQAQQQQLAQQLAAAEALLGEVAPAADLRQLQQQLSERLDRLQAGLAAIPAPYDDSALGSRLAGAEAALAALQSSMAEIAAAIGTLHVEGLAGEGEESDVGTGEGTAPKAPAQQQPLSAQLAGLMQEVAALRAAVGEVQSGAAAAAEKGGAEGQVLLQLTAAVGQLSDHHAALQGMLEGMGQEQSELAAAQADLASRVDALPALLLAERSAGPASQRSSPGPAVPVLSLSQLSGAASGAHALESHPLLTARTWYDDSSSDLGTDDSDTAGAAGEVAELRASLAAQTKQGIRLEAIVAEQAAKIDRLEGQLHDMRVLVAALATGSPAPHRQPFPAATPGYSAPLRRPFGSSRPNDTPFSTTASQRSMYWDACSEWGGSSCGDLAGDLASPAPLLAAPPQRQPLRPAGGPQAGAPGGTAPAAAWQPSPKPAAVGRQQEAAVATPSAASSTDTSFGLGAVLPAAAAAARGAAAARPGSSTPGSKAAGAVAPSQPGLPDITNSAELPRRGESAETGKAGEREGSFAQRRPFTAKPAVH